MAIVAGKIAGFDIKLSCGGVDLGVVLALVQSALAESSRQPNYLDKEQANCDSQQDDRQSRCGNNANKEFAGVSRSGAGSRFRSTAYADRGGREHD